MKEIEISFKSECERNGYTGDYESYQGPSFIMMFHKVTRGKGYPKSLLSKAFTKLVPKSEYDGMKRSEVIQHCYKFSDKKYK